MKAPRQASLFEDLPASGAELLRIDRSSAKLSPAQQTFNRLTAQIEQTRADLLQFQALERKLHERAQSQLNPALAQIRAAQIRLLLQIDQLLSTPARPALKRRSIQILTQFVIYLGENLLRAEHPAEPEPELITIFDRYSEVSASDMRAAEHAMHLKFAEEMLGAGLGDELLKDHGAADLDELLHTVSERFAEQVADAAQQAPPRQNKRQKAAAARKAQEQREASQSVREIYRKLASSLHPDRETDPVQRQRKTELMQQINVAYEKADLLALLTLQMEVEQLNAAGLAQLPEARLKHYNHVLKEQQQTLQAELQTRMDVLKQLLGSVGDRAWQLRKPLDFEREFEHQLRALRAQQRGIESSTHALLDPKRRAAQIDAFARELLASDEEEEEAAMFELLSQMGGFGHQGGSRSRSKRR